MKTKEKKIIRINDTERNVLEFLAKEWDSEQNCYYFRGIVSHTELELKQVRRACRSLAKNGFAEYVRGLFDQDGIVAGSGYCATYDGAKFIDPCNDCGELASMFLDEDWQDKKEEDRRMLCNVCYGKKSKL